MRKKNSIFSRFFTTLVATVVVVSQMQITISAEPVSNTVLINEIESSDPNKGNDWIEIINTGSEDVDISQWFVVDDKGLDRKVSSETTPLEQGTILKAGHVFVFEESFHFDFGLGKEDTVTLYNGNSELMDTYSWSGHAVGTYSRVPGSLTEYKDQDATKGKPNIIDTIIDQPEALVINEINSSPDDWVEFMNVGDTELNISGYEIRDNSDDHRWIFPENTVLKSRELLVVDAKSKGYIYDDQTHETVPGTFEEAIGIGSGDAIRLYNKEGELIDTYAWTQHPSFGGDESKASYGRFPDGTGDFTLTYETPSAPNQWHTPSIVINEIESNGDTTDWVEIYNTGSSPVDITGWYILDNDPVGHANETTPITTPTIIEPGSFYVFDQNTHFIFGLGKNDHVSVYNQNGVIVTEYAWSDHASGVFARIPDGVGDFVDFETSTKGKANIATNPVVISEVQSNDPNKGPDWIELANPTSSDLDISGLVIKDNDDSHAYVIPENTHIKAFGYLVITEDEFGFGLGKNDSVRLYEDNHLIGSTTWTDHTNPTWGLFPDTKGNEFRNTLKPTPGAANVFAETPTTIKWPGDQNITTYDTEPMFLQDSSGLDIHNNQLYAVDNGTGKFWILDINDDGSLTFVKGFENGKRARFQKDADNVKAKGPDAEGISVDGDGLVYIASERDNSFKGINYNVILQIDPTQDGDDLIAMKEWDLTASLPQVSANMGIEAVEWVSNTDMKNQLIDQNTQAPYDPSNYPNAIANGIFFVALEDNGHVYAYVLNDDGSFIQIADIDSKLGGAMALDYNDGLLWVVADDGYNNAAATLRFNGTETVHVTHVSAPEGVDTSRNNEGFAISKNETADGQKTVYRFADGFETGSLTIGSLDSKSSEIPADPTFHLENEQLNLKVGDVSQLNVISSTNDGLKSVVWSSKDESIVSIDQDGNVRALSQGVVEIDARINDTLTLTATITVNGTHFPQAPAPKVTESFATYRGHGDLTAIIDKDASLFGSILVDDKGLEDSHYTITSGSTIVTLKESYLQTLPNGKYNVDVHFSDGTSVVLNLNVEITKESSTTLPATGLSESFLGLYVVGSGVAIVIGTKLKKKRKIH